MKAKEGAIIASIIIGCTIFAVWLIVATTAQVDDRFDGVLWESNAYEEPTSTEIRQMCVDKLNELMGPEYVTPLGINVCVGTVLDGLNK